MAKITNGVSARGYKIADRYVSLFGKNFNFINESGHIKERYRPLGMQAGRTYNTYRSYTDDMGRQRKLGRWKTGIGNLGGEMTMQQLFNHFRVVRYNIEKNSLNFIILLSERALEIFQRSFKIKAFNSRGGQKWPELSESTKNVRRKRGTWPGAGRALMELGELYSSLKLESGKFGGKIYTDPAAFKAETYSDRIKGSKRNKSAAKKIYKRRKVCAAAVHNEGAAGGYTFWGNRPAVRRQFIGHSTYLISFANSIIKRYMFDDVFVIKA